MHYRGLEGVPQHARNLLISLGPVVRGVLAISRKQLITADTGEQNRGLFAPLDTPGTPG
jgi:hypothetical protein